MSYISLSFALGDLAAERAEQACFDAGALSVTFSDLRDDAVLEPAVGEMRLWPATRLQALYTGDADGTALHARLQQLLGLDAAAIQTEIIADRVWEREWLRDFHAMRFGQRLWVCPHHETVTATDAVVVKLDPGLAFGTGTHASTALCLEWLDAHLAHGMSVIDYGCGSGILAIAALKLGATRATAFDIDPQALIATLDNAERNNVTAALATASRATALQTAADVVLANILAGTLIELADSLATLVRPGGQIVLAGILAEQAPAVALAFAACFDIRVAGQREGWVLLAGTRIGASHTKC
jgi:ribosomal protein L11 methyltransferase